VLQPAQQPGHASVHCPGPSQAPKRLPPLLALREALCDAELPPLPLEPSTVAEPLHATRAARSKKRTLRNPISEMIPQHERTKPR
jgi:hypothetical protein